MLAGEDLGRGHQRGLAAGLDGGQHGEEGDQGLAGADVALEQAVHPVGRRHVGGDLGDGAGLGAGGGIGQGGEDRCLQRGRRRGWRRPRARFIRARAMARVSWWESSSS